MKWIKKSYLIFIFLFGIYSTSHGQNQLALSKADSLFSNGDYQLAAIEYERFLYFSSDQTQMLDILYQKAQCYKQLSKFTKACKTLERIRLYNETPDRYAQIKKELSLCYYLDNQIQKAQIQISQLRHKLKNKNLPKETLLVEIFILNELKKWDMAEELAKEYINTNEVNNKTLALQKIDSLYSKKNLPKLKSIEKAENLSRFIPGSGQMYCGKVLEGSFTFLFNGAFLALGIQQILTKFYLTGYAAGFGVLHKTYTGNMARTKHLAIKVNHERHTLFNESIINYLLSL
ncbi:hypothetical protein EV201_2523 [Ancylomarina subtilis]|uniref:Tetratricopeptide repeat protein n=1 Tax=Ancylomarina subtilis TaxID=1639035 RepID=A0A4Q7VE51_9BACT|nr:hypothetical protein [Ancylomarina subtilis]RZT93362.1 hypothetical protein EV201_2523 [Ancylomarina subtilis]